MYEYYYIRVDSEEGVRKVNVIEEGRRRLCVRVSKYRRF